MLRSPIYDLFFLPRMSVPTWTVSLDNYHTHSNVYDGVTARLLWIIISFNHIASEFHLFINDPGNDLNFSIDLITPVAYSSMVQSSPTGILIRQRTYLMVLVASLLNQHMVQIVGAGHVNRHALIIRLSLLSLNKWSTS